MTFIQSRLAPLACTVLAVGLLSACDQAQRPTPKAGTVAAAWQPLPDKPLFSDPIVKDHDVLPAAKADTKTPDAKKIPDKNADSDFDLAGLELSQDELDRLAAE